MPQSLPSTNADGTDPSLINICCRLKSLFKGYLGGFDELARNLTKFGVCGHCLGQGVLLSADEYRVLTGLSRPDILDAEIIE